ncbi:hypothetical protein Ahy_B08g093266 [Arachis hypogaea]|uniref:Uncharacterized protein n=1 Tax=Arachis hypogaea TaxID=3818 RepID=A0A444Y5K6_ARAHY|nr:hypothetical protein Ahy_B08g093266 [Arachis hypogaea]
MAQGHLIPMMDLAKLLLQHNNNIIVTIITTPQNAARFTSTFARYIHSGYQIRQIQLQFPYQETGLPEGCENLDMLHSLGNAFNFFNAASLLREPVEKIFEELSPPACCIVSNMNLPYTIHVAKKFKIPRVSFAGVSCFCLMCYDALCTSPIFSAKSSNIFGKQTIQPRINPLIQIIPRSLCNRISKSNPTNNSTEHYSRVHVEVKGSQENASESSHCCDADHTSEAYSGRNNWRPPWGPIFSSFSSVTPYTLCSFLFFQELKHDGSIGHPSACRSRPCGSKRDITRRKSANG